MEIQVIDYKDKNASAAFTEALKEIGFAVLANHPINPQLFVDNYEGWHQFFHSAEKNAFAFDRKTHDGFVASELSEKAKNHTMKDIKEFYHFYPWGRCPDQLRDKTHQLFSDLNNLAIKLLQWVQQHTPIEIKEKLSMPLSEMIQNSQHSMLRIIHYPPLTGEEPAGAMRAAPHEDINLLTLLPAATAKGLQVKDLDLNWLNVPINPNWIVVNTADMLQECTGSYYPSTTHRVVNPVDDHSNDCRLSIPLFLHPRDDVRLSDRHTAASYRAERFAELGLDS